MSAGVLAIICIEYDVQQWWHFSKNYPRNYRYLFVFAKIEIIGLVYIFVQKSLTATILPGQGYEFTYFKWQTIPKSIRGTGKFVVNNSQ